MEKELTILQPQLGFNKCTGEWYGAAPVMESLNYITSKLGILDWELYRKALAEYVRNRDVYDMGHNNSRLLRARIIGLANECYQKGNPDNEWLDEAIVNLHMSIEYSKTNFDYFNSNYPIFPLGYYKQIIQIAKGVTGFVNIGDSRRSDFNSETSFIKPLISRHLVHFYSDWEKHSKAPNLWAQGIISDLTNVDYGQYQDMAKKQIMAKLTELSEEGVYFDISLMRKEIRRRTWWYKLINLFTK